MFKSSQGFVERAGKSVSVISTKRSKPKQTGFVSLTSSMSESRNPSYLSQNKSYCFGGVTYNSQGQQPRLSSGGLSSANGGTVLNHQHHNQNNNNINNNNDNNINSNGKGKTFEPFYDRGKYRTRRVRNSIETEDFERRSSAVHDLLKVVAAPVLNRDVRSTFSYENSRTFEQALEYYNRLGVTDIVEDEKNLLQPVTWACKWHWTQTGRVRAGQQMCVQCRDLGKSKNLMEKYYLNAVEIAVSRTVLCYKCMGLRLKSNVGNESAEILKKLTVLRQNQAKINTCRVNGR